MNPFFGTSFLSLGWTEPFVLPPGARSHYICFIHAAFKLKYTQKSFIPSVFCPKEQRYTVSESAQRVLSCLYVLHCVLQVLQSFCIIREVQLLSVTTCCIKTEVPKSPRRIPARPALPDSDAGKPQINATVAEDVSSIHFPVYTSALTTRLKYI